MTTLIDEIKAKCDPKLIAAREHGQIAAGWINELK